VFDRATTTPSSRVHRVAPVDVSTSTTAVCCWYPGFTTEGRRSGLDRRCSASLGRGGGTAGGTGAIFSPVAASVTAPTERLSSATSRSPRAQRRPGCVRRIFPVAMSMMVETH
jgi:hypothetical protein